MSQITFSEHGEDILIHRLLLWKKCGFYVDVGAYHPVNMSLTARLRNFGWRGINIDVDPRAIALFDQFVPYCMNVCAAVSDKTDAATIYKYSNGVLNTLDSQQNAWLEQIAARGELFTEFIGSETVQTTSLADILTRTNCSEVDYLNIDIEGLELQALLGFPWELFRPTIISVEIHRLNLSSANANEIVNYMNSVGYRLQSYVFHTAIFCLAEFDEEICHRFEPVIL